MDPYRVPLLEGEQSATEAELGELAPAETTSTTSAPAPSFKRQNTGPVRQVNFDSDTYGEAHDLTSDEPSKDSPISSRTRSATSALVPRSTALLVCTALVNFAREYLASTPDNQVAALCSFSPLNNIVMNTTLSSKYLGGGFTYTERLTSKEVREVERLAEEPYDVEKLMCLAAIPRRKRKTQTINGQLYEIPRDYADSQSPEFKGFWDKANNDEIAVIVAKESLGEPSTKKPPEHLIITTRFDYRIKTKKDGSIDKPKARCVVRGFMQKFGVHYRETYAPTLMKDSTRLIFYLVAIGLYPMTFDVKCAFMCAKADFLLYTELTPGMPGYDPLVRKWAQILTAWYGTHQAGKLWNDLASEVLLEIGYTRCDSDHGLWYRYSTCTKQYFSVIGLFVDDMPGASEGPNEVYRVVNALESRFEITWKPTLDKVLGLLVHVNPNNDVIVYNDTYFDDLAAALEMTDLKPAKSFGDPKVHFQPNTMAKAPPALCKKYQKTIGGLLWPSLQWKPVTNHIVTQLGRFTHNPSFEHFDAAIGVLRYFLGTKRLGLCFRRPNMTVPKPLRLSLLSYYDSDWASDWDRISNSGCVISIHFPAEIAYAERTGSWPHFNVLDYIARKQHGFAASSSAAAESKASTVAVSAVTGLRGLLTELRLMLKDDPPTWLLGDNDAATINLREDRTTPKTRSYELDIVVTRQAIRNKMIKPGKIPSADNLADSQTKIQAAVDRDRFIDRTMSTAQPGESLPFRNQVTNDHPRSGSKRKLGAQPDSVRK